MLSKLLPWDFIQKYPETIDPKKPGIYFYYINNSYLHHIVTERINKKEIDFSVYTGSEVTKDFLENEFVNLSFFTNTNSIEVINAEQMPSNTFELFSEERIDASGRFLVVFFSKKNKLFTDCAKLASVQAFEVEEPRFWEGPRLWQFTQQVSGVKYNQDINAFILDSLEHNFESFLWAINLIKVNFPDGQIQLTELRELIKKQRWDIFEFVNLFHKNPKSFFLELLKKEEVDFEFLRSTFAFMQGHLAKVLHPEEILAKAKHSNYDKDILSYAKICNKNDVLNYIRLFSDFEIKAKLSDLFLIDAIRLETLK